MVSVIPKQRSNAYLIQLFVHKNPIKDFSGMMEPKLVCNAQVIALLVSMKLLV